MRVSLGKYAMTAACDMFKTHSTIRNLTHKIKGEEQEAFMDTFFFTSRYFLMTQRSEKWNVQQSATELNGHATNSK